MKSRPFAFAFALLPLFLASTVWVQAALAASTAPKFDVLEYAVEGNSRLPDIEIETAVTPFLGEAKTLSDVQAARAALERAYHDAGYLTAVVIIPPEQEVSDGVVTLRVIEGEVERLRVKGAQYHLPSEIKSKVGELAEGSVPYFPQVQRQLAAVNRSADLKSTPVLRAGKAPGTVEVDIDVDDQLPLHGSVDYSNRGTPNTTPQRLSGSFRYDNLWQRGHSLALTAQTSPQNKSEVKVLGATYVAPVAAAGDALAAYAVHSRSTMATIASSPGLGVLGNTDILGLRYAMPLRATAEYSHTLSLGLDRKIVRQSQILAGIESPDPISYTPLVGTYNGNWFGRGSTTAVDATATLGLRNLLGNHEAAFQNKINNTSDPTRWTRSGSAGFLVLRGGWQRSENLGRWLLAARLEAQIASGMLLPSEQYSAGGAESVRGYLDSEKFGDEALRLATELRTPRLSIGDAAAPWQLQGLVFYEGVRLRPQPAANQQIAWELMRGGGIGLRLAGPHGLSADLDWAHAVDAGAPTQAHSHRLHGRLLWNF